MKTRMNQIKKIKRGWIVLTLFITLGLVSCREDEPNPDEAGITTPSDADGYLIADRTSEAGSSSTFNTARAAFSNTPGVTGSFVDVGVVKCNSITLTKVASNLYQAVGTPNFSTGTLSWEVAGANGFGAFTRTGMTFPTKPVISSSANVTKSGFTITNNAITGADKLLYTIGSQAIPSKLKLKYATTASATSMTFSSSDLSGFTVGEDVVTLVTAYKISTETLGGKKIYIQISSQDTKRGIIN